MKTFRLVLLLLAAFFIAAPAPAADYPDPREGSWVARDFRFHTGEVLPELQQHLAELLRAAPKRQALSN